MLQSGFPDSSVDKESICNEGDPGSILGLGRSAGEGIGYPLQYSWASLVAHKESACLWGDLGSIPEVGKIPWRRKSYPLQYSGLENSMDCIVYGITKSWTQLSDFHFTCYNFNAWRVAFYGWAKTVFLRMQSTGEDAVKIIEMTKYLEYYLNLGNINLCVI